VKPAAFAYHRPASIEEALSILDKVAPEGGRVLAGGQSLMPMMALRVAFPSDLVDINHIAGLGRISADNGVLAIGALARHGAFHRPVCAGPLGHLLAEVSHHIAHYPIRQRGTFCGSLAHADSASEWCLVAATLDAVVHARHHGGSREIPIAAFFAGPMTTVLEPQELLAEVRIALLAAGTRFGFYEFNRRAGDLALVMCLATFRLENGVIAAPRVGVGAVQDNPRRLPEVEAELLGQLPSEAVFGRAAQAAAQAITPFEDEPQAALYQRDLAQAAVMRALRRALREPAALTTETMKQ
jgi:carbon-monoxide dehydrogenase medium subunit